MNNGVTLDFPKADVDALFKQMDNAQKYLGHDAGRSLKTAMTHVIKSIGVSTKMAPAFRKIVENVGPTDKWAAQHGYGTFLVSGWFGRPRKEMTKTVRGRTLETAKKKHATIGRRGLAKAVWHAAGYGKGPSAKFGPMVKVIAEKFVDSKENLTRGTDLYIEVRNVLPYAMAALQGGPKEVTSAMARAAKGMQLSIENQLLRRMGMGRLAR